VVVVTVMMTVMVTVTVMIGGGNWRGIGGGWRQSAA